MKDKIISFFKGAWIGGTMTVPGVSGGSMAMILNIYERVINSVSSFRKDVKNNLIFLIIFASGGLLGALLFSKYIIMPLMELYPMPTGYFFLGAVAGGAPIILKTANVKKVNFKTFACPIAGMIPVLLIALIPNGIFHQTNSLTVAGCVIQLFGGLFVAIPLVLPGISVSQVLLMMGIYETLIKAAGTADFATLFSFTPMYIGIIIGTLAMAKIMDKAMTKYPTVTYLVIFGFLLGSLPQLMLFAGLPTGLDIPICIVTAFAGFCFIYFLQILDGTRKGSK